MTREEFKNQYIVDVKIKINNREECYQFQKIAFEFGAKVHSNMKYDVQEPILYNITDEYPHYEGKSFATDMTNLVIYDNGKRIQKSSFYHLEKNKEINFDEFMNAYNSLN